MLPSERDPKRRSAKIHERSTLDGGEGDKRATRHTSVGPGIPAAIIAPGSVGYLNPSVPSWFHPGAILSSESPTSLAPVSVSFPYTMLSTREAVLEGILRVWRKERRRMAAGENLRRPKRSPRKNSFNNRSLIAGAVGEVIMPANLGVARRGDTGQEGRIAVISHDGILDAVGAERPEAVGVDGGVVELVGVALLGVCAHPLRPRELLPDLHQYLGLQGDKHII